MKVNGVIRRMVGMAYATVLMTSCVMIVKAGEAEPFIYSAETKEGQLTVNVHVPSGYRQAVLEISSDVKGDWNAIAAGNITGEEGLVSFTLPDGEPIRFMRIRAGQEGALPKVPFHGQKHFSFEPGFFQFPEKQPEQPYPSFGVTPVWDLGETKKIGHLLNRVAYGPSLEDVTRVEEMGIRPYILSQLKAGNPNRPLPQRLSEKEEELFDYHQPAHDRKRIEDGDTWRYFKGTKNPPRTWLDVGFDDSEWLQGRSGFGYGDNDDRTELDDMRQKPDEPDYPGQPGYLSLFIRRAFYVPNPEEIKELIFRADYDDGFVAFLNGEELARANMNSPHPRYNAKATKGHESGEPEDFDATEKVVLLQKGLNVLAIQVHNDKITSGDLSMIPELIQRKTIEGPPVKRIKDIRSLQQLVHLRGAYSDRQLQTVLAEFWENHFTTDYDKLVEYLEDLENSDGRESMARAQARREAAQMEWIEYDFLYRNALGNFGDLLLYSATSPSMLIYLDNVLNEKGEPNENYAREIMELFAFGVDNRYMQKDIEELSRTFTGWTVRKVWPADRKPFPKSSREPPTGESVNIRDTNQLKTGRVWRYFKGKKEPSTKVENGETIASTDWTLPGFNENRWSRGVVSIGYGDGDDKTILSDMKNSYTSVYLRHSFTMEDPYEMQNLLLKLEYDDGYVAYLNGTEIARSSNMRYAGNPPPFDAMASSNHEVTQKPELTDLKDFLHLINPASENNVLAIQVCNVSKGSSDLSVRPQLVHREMLPGSIENGDPNGVWTFRFDPKKHDTGRKVLFKGTEHEHLIPASRNGPKEAIDFIDFMVDHPSTSEFICVKLINKFVSDQISLNSLHSRTAPPELLELADTAIAAWHSTQPAGNISKVIRTILDPIEQQNAFWSDIAYRTKIKTPVEYINSSIRALNADVTGTTLPGFNSDMEMEFFVRDDPDGWSEIGHDWMDTGSLLERINFSQILAENDAKQFSWDASALFQESSLENPIKVLVPSDGSSRLDWTRPEFNDASWQGSGTSAGYDTNPTYSELIDIDLKTQMHKKNTSVYIRMPFFVENPEAFDYLRLGMRYDDGFVAYLNGVRIAAANAPSTPLWNSKATEGHTDSEAVEFQDFSLTRRIGLLRKGRNILAIHGLNSSNTSSDLLISPRLRGGLGGAESAIDYFDKLLFQRSLTVEQRKVLLQYVNSNNVGRPQRLDPSTPNYIERVQEMVGLILSMPQWHYQ